ncbi:unnamed protein product [Brassica rapa subsp. narinosa]
MNLHRVTYPIFTEDGTPKIWGRKFWGRKCMIFVRKLGEAKIMVELELHKPFS